VGNVIARASLGYADTSAPLSGVLRHLVARTPGTDPLTQLVAVLIPADEVPAGATILGTLVVTREGLSTAGSPAPEGVLVDLESRTVIASGRVLTLTRLEFDLLAHLVTTPRRVYTRDQLHSSIWEGKSAGGIRTVDVHVHRLRDKLGPAHQSHLVTVRGVGYRWDPDLRETTPHTHREADQ
jgi:DNA-binding winged helix-turn-helix (wHTH) protein